MSVSPRAASKETDEEEEEEKKKKKKESAPVLLVHEGRPRERLKKKKKKGRRSIRGRRKAETPQYEVLPRRCPQPARAVGEASREMTKKRGWGGKRKKKKERKEKNSNWLSVCFGSSRPLRQEKKRERSVGCLVSRVSPGADSKEDWRGWRSFS